jgi:protein-glutamine gamma-glutamyltransferase
MSALERDTRWRLAAFVGLSALVAWRYGGVQIPVPTIRVVALAGIAVVAAVAMIVLGARRSAVARTAALSLLTVLALMAAGVPAGLLSPLRWGTLAARLGGGLGAVGTTLWPYAGDDRWTRLDLLLVPAAAPIAAAGLAFWSSRGGRLAGVRAGVRHIAALALLLGVYVLGLLDSDGGSVTVEGLILFVLVGAWFWPIQIHRRGGAAALGWVAVAGAAAAALTGELGGAQPWLDYRGWNLLGTSNPGVSFSWDQTYGPLRWSRSERTMFTVTAPRSQLWKTTTLDQFDGTRFVRSDTPPAADQDLPLPLNDGWYRFVQFTIAGLDTKLLPAEQGVTAGVRIRVPIDYEQDGTVMARQTSLPSGTTYTVMSYVPDPAPADLRAAPRAFPSDYARYTEFELPGASPSAPRPTVTSRDERLILASPYGPMYRLARRLADGRRNAYDVALAIERYLEANEAYDERVPIRRFPLESFLFTDHVGYCQQFSGAMALMLRMDGIPARIAAGFLPGTYDAARRRWVVRAVDAHSWVEVFFSGVGWIPFDPTPPRVAGTPQYPLFTSARAARVTQMQAIAATVGGPPAVPAHRPRSRPRRAVGAIKVGMWAAATVVLLALAALGMRWVAGWTRLRRSLDGDGELATRELVQALGRLGYTLPAPVTLTRIEAIVDVHGGEDGVRYVRRLRDRRYGPRTDVSVTLAQRRRLRRSITGPLGLDARLKGLWALPPGTVAWGLKDHAGGP